MLNAFEGPEHLPFTFDGANGGAVLLTHGFPGSAKEMRPIAHALNDAGWTTHGVLLPGFGPAIETLGERQHTEWQQTVSTALAELQASYSPVIVAGNSMGGALSIHAAAKHGADGLILFAPFWTLDNLLWKALPVLRYIIPKFKPFKLIKPDFDDPEFQKGTRNFMPNADFSDPEFRKQTLNLEVDTRVFANIRAAGMDGYHAAPDIHVPTLIIQGSEDELVTPTATSQLIDRLNGENTYIRVAAPHNPLDPEKPYWPTVVESVLAFSSQFVPLAAQS